MPKTQLKNLVVPNTPIFDSFNWIDIPDWLFENQGEYLRSCITGRDQANFVMFKDKEISNWNIFTSWMLLTWKNKIIFFLLLLFLLSSPRAVLLEPSTSFDDSSQRVCLSDFTSESSQGIFPSMNDPIFLVIDRTFLHVGKMRPINY